MRQFVQTFTQNKLKDTLPQVLERCGYRNVVFYPMLKNFVSNDRFYNSIGLKEIFDLKAQGAKTAQERDRFYFDNAMAEMGRHFEASQPAAVHLHPDHVGALALRLQVSSPRSTCPAADPARNPEMHEYLRRVSMAKMDYDYLARRVAPPLPARALPDRALRRPSSDGDPHPARLQG